jgi:hypothetical protein
MSRFEAVSSDAGSLSLHACAVIMALALIAASALSVVHAALAYRTEPSPGPVERPMSSFMKPCARG